MVGLPAPRLAAGQDPSATAVQAKSLLENMLGMGAETKQTQRREGQAMLDADAAEAEGTAPPAQTEQHPPFVFCTEGTSHLSLSFLVLSFWFFSSRERVYVCGVLTGVVVVPGEGVSAGRLCVSVGSESPFVL